MSSNADQVVLEAFEHLHGNRAFEVVIEHIRKMRETADRDLRDAGDLVSMGRAQGAVATLERLEQLHASARDVLEQMKQRNAKAAPLQRGAGAW